MMNKSNYICAFLLVLLSTAPAWSIQCSYPTGDEDNSTYYWDTPGASATHYTTIDEDTTCSYTISVADEIDEDDGSWYHATMLAVTDPEVSTGHTWTCQGSISSNKSHTVTCDLYQSTTKINTSTACTTSSWTGANALLQCTLTGTEADTITDYASIVIRMYATASTPTNVYMDKVNFEVPDAPAGARSRAHVIGD